MAGNRRSKSEKVNAAGVPFDPFSGEHERRFTVRLVGFGRGEEEEENGTGGVAGVAGWPRIGPAKWLHRSGERERESVGGGERRIRKKNVWDFPK